MAKVLFVVYVPSTDEETDDDDMNKNAVEEDDTKQGKDAEIDGKDNGDGNMTEKENSSDSLTKLTSEQQEDKEVTEQLQEDKEVTEQLKEDKSDETAEDESGDNIFFKDIKKEDSVESTAKAEMDSESNVTEETNNESEKEPESKKPTFVRFLSEKLTLIKKVKRVLEDLNLKGAQWNKTDQNVYIGMFVADDGAQCEEILRKLSMLQIGIIKDSSVSVFPASISSEEKWIEEEIQQEQEKADELSEKVTRFKNSIKSRLVVDQVVNAVKNDAKFTFDYLMLVILASLVAIMGLLESSSVVLVASMLISPLMGPILAGVFGVVIRKGDLIRVGIVNEIRGLTICVFIGFVIGFIPACLEVGSSRWRSSSEWPTPEMSSRGALRALPVGILIAIPSGAGVALSILGGKVGSLVGVAISASLLPPAVNAGLLWANAIVAAISPPPIVKNEVNASYLELNQTSSHGLTCASLANNDYERYYFCSMASESVILGLISLLLTILNIICIILMGVIVLKIKEVAPIPHSIIPESETEFFCQDLKSRIQRRHYISTRVNMEWALIINCLKNERKVMQCQKIVSQTRPEKWQLASGIKTMLEWQRPPYW